MVRKADPKLRDPTSWLSGRGCELTQPMTHLLLPSLYVKYPETNKRSGPAAKVLSAAPIGNSSGAHYNLPRYRIFPSQTHSLTQAQTLNLKFSQKLK